MFSIIGEFLAKYGGARFLDYFFKHVLKMQKLRPVANWEASIERVIPDAKIYGVVLEEPILKLNGTYPFTDQQIAAAESLRSTIRINDPHAMLLQAPDLLHSPVQLKAYTLDYAALEVLRNENKHQHIVSANAVIVCPDARVLVLQHRSPKSRTFPDCIHIIGGAYQPPNITPGIDFDSLSLKSTAQREVKEETNIVITCDSFPPMLLAEEQSTRFFQFVLLGADISVNQLNCLKENWESTGIVKDPFDKLRTFLVSPPKPWTPSGKAHVLAWLALGAPGAGRSPKFGKLSPQNLFLDVVSLH